MLKVALVLGVVALLYFGKTLLLPVVVAGLLAMLLNPLDNKLQGMGWPYWASITVCMLLLLLFFGGLFFAIGQQASNFADNWSEIEQRVTEQLTKVTESVPALKGILPSPDQITNPSTQSGGGTTGDVAGSLPGGGSVTGLLSSTLGIVGDFMLMLVYVVLFLATKERLRNFLVRRTTTDAERGTAHRSINESLDIVQQYLKGRLMLIAFLSVVYGIGFTVGGLEYAIFLAVLVAVLSIIPYLGNIIGAAIAVAVAVAGGAGSTGIIAIGVTMTLGQILESYVLLPLVVGKEVDINPLTTIIGVMAFTIMWGPVGAIVSIPILAMIRVVCSHIDGLEDYAYLLGQD